MTDQGQRVAVPNVVTKSTAKRKMAKGNRPPSPDTPPLPELSDDDSADLRMPKERALRQAKGDLERAKRQKTLHDSVMFTIHGARIIPSKKDKSTSQSSDTQNLRITTSKDGTACREHDDRSTATSRFGIDGYK